MAGINSTELDYGSNSTIWLALDLDQFSTYLYGRILSFSRNNFGIFDKITGKVQTTDFDLSVRGDWTFTGCEMYRAPEVIFDAGYAYSADI
ncbi:hypothetical protein PENANT_c011G07729 [Penicillium antarcticum]|uniref:Uncharacterized protein n=1 Tax=Penicillium antarcticum TaxID=416450 RepID=A0A1V6Q799_9EURO|nr:hypothetical protein PENANT_c011G07729 [Penicillium antarcticum]